MLGEHHVRGTIHPNFAEKCLNNMFLINARPWPPRHNVAAIQDKSEKHTCGPAPAWQQLPFTESGWPSYVAVFNIRQSQFGALGASASQQMSQSVRKRASMDLSKRVAMLFVVGHIVSSDIMMA